MRSRPETAGRSVSEVLTDIVLNIQDMLRFEIRLVQSEVRAHLRSARTAGLLMVAAFIATLWCVFFLLLALYGGLRHVMPPWVAAVCIAAGLAVTAVATGAAAVQRLRRQELMTRTRAETPEHVKEPVGWARAAMK
jgi:cytochrome c biogenesis protein CcdA